LDTEGYAVARPSHSGESLVRAASSFSGRPDLILAHGTGTEINDATEDLAFSKLFPEGTPPIAGSKWCVGHTLGASAAIDVILACEAICRQETFGLATTAEADPAFKGNYRLRAGPLVVKSVQISSLGFGGAHAMARVSYDR
jgi:3-oxoacyl-[acyl-carrier-protein] synthase II